MAHLVRFGFSALVLSSFVTACAVGVEDEYDAPSISVQDSTPPPAVAPGSGNDGTDTSASSGGDPVYFGQENALGSPADVDTEASYTFELVADAHMTIELERRSQEGPATIGFTLHRLSGSESTELGRVYGHHGAAAMSLYTVHGGTYAIRLLDGLNPELLVLHLDCNSGSCAARRQPGESCGDADGMRCDDGLACVFADGACQQAEAQTHCKLVPNDCPKTYAPVCGCNGKTWGNACFAHQAGVSILHDGDCESN